VKEWCEAAIVNVFIVDNGKILYQQFLSFAELSGLFNTFEGGEALTYIV
jgi:hypothetical protein